MAKLASSCNDMSSTSGNNKDDTLRGLSWRSCQYKQRVVVVQMANNAVHHYGGVSGGGGGSGGGGRGCKSAKTGCI